MYTETANELIYMQTLRKNRNGDNLFGLTRLKTSITCIRIQHLTNHQRTMKPLANEAISPVDRRGSLSGARQLQGSRDHEEDLDLHKMRSDRDGHNRLAAACTTPSRAQLGALA